MRVVVVAVVVSSFAVVASAATRCDVKAVFSIDRDVPDVEVVTRKGDVVDLRSLIEGFFVKARLNTGTYEVNVRRKEANVYEIRGKDLLIRTQYCYQYAYGDDAILRITGTAGWTIGTLIFE